MKVGDLVQLSSYGSERHYNEDLLPGKHTRMALVGILIAVKNNRNFPYVVMWSPEHTKRGHIRRELKHARKTNEAG